MAPMMAMEPMQEQLPPCDKPCVKGLPQGETAPFCEVAHPVQPVVQPKPSPMSAPRTRLARTATASCIFRPMPTPRQSVKSPMQGAIVPAQAFGDETP